MNTDFLKPKPLERDNKIKVPKELKKVKVTKKPLIGLNFSDRVNILLGKLADFIILKIPIWFWVILLLIILFLFYNRMF